MGQLYIIARGIVVKNWRFFGVGKVWGEDMLIKNPELVDHAQGVAVTYVEAYYLRKSDFVRHHVRIPRCDCTSNAWYGGLASNVLSP